MNIFSSWRRPEGKVFYAQLLISLLISSILTVNGAPQLANPYAEAGFVLLFALNTFSAIFCVQLSLNILLRLGQWPRHLAPAFAVGVACLGLSLGEGISSLRLPPSFTCLFVGACFLLMCWATHELMTGVLELEKSERVSLIICVGIFLLGPSSWELRSLDLQGVELTTLRIARWTYLSLVLYPAFIGSIRALARQQRKDYQRSSGGGKSSLIDKNFWRKPFDQVSFPSAHWAVSLLNLGLVQWLLATFDDPAPGWQISEALWVTASLQGIPAFLWARRSWTKAHRRPRHIRSQSVHNIKRAASLLEQHHYGQVGQQETWLGYRTAVLMIDHDPNEECRSHLPSFLYRARQMQCEQIIQRTFGDQITSFNTAGSQLTIAVDTERTHATCTEALLILTVLYLDGLPLIEKRLKQLVRLMPLLDPDLGQSLSESRIEALFSRLQGFFHLDYSWIDQSMQSDSHEANIEIRLENLNPRERHRVLTQLSAAQWLGNFIWISEAARDQLRSESPFLASTIERWPIQLEQSHGRQLETAIFLIKFENLIPRLQRYFGFDSIRSRLAPLPISDATQNILDRIEARVDDIKSLNLRDLQEQIELIKSHEWQGYRAKDLALEFVLKLVAGAEVLRESQKIESEQLSLFRRLAKELVQEIGYPSQELHSAHMRKLEIRQISELQRICLDLEHPRCYEAWLLLASLPVRKLGHDAVMQLMQLVGTVSRSRTLRRKTFILNKAVETYFQLARSLPSNRENEMQKILEQVATALLDVQADPGLLLSFMDKKLALDQQRGHGLGLSTALLLRWDKTISERIEKGDLSTAQQSALNLRWKSFRQNISDAPLLAS